MNDIEVQLRAGLLEADLQDAQRSLTPDIKNVLLSRLENERTVENRVKDSYKCSLRPLWTERDPYSAYMVTLHGSAVEGAALELLDISAITNSLVDLLRPLAENRGVPYAIERSDDTTRKIFPTREEFERHKLLMTACGSSLFVAQAKRDFEGLEKGIIASMDYAERTLRRIPKDHVVEGASPEEVLNKMARDPHFGSLLPDMLHVTDIGGVMDRLVEELRITAFVVMHTAPSFVDYQIERIYSPHA